MKNIKILNFIFLAWFYSLIATAAVSPSEPIGEPVIEPATLHSLGVYWIVRGDDNQNAKIEVRYRLANVEEDENRWKPAPNLFRVEKGASIGQRFRSKLKVAPDVWLFAGSVLLLKPDTAYELKLSLTDPDNDESTGKTLKARTIAEPKIDNNRQTEYHVVPGNGGGSGRTNDPCKGLQAAQANAKPGDTFLLHKGVYAGTFLVNKSGSPGKPIIWRGAGDGEAIIDGKGNAEKRPGRGISANDAHDVWFEGITIRNADYGFVGHNAYRIVIRRCHIHSVNYGITNTNNSKDRVKSWFISDNLMEGPSTWPRTKDIEGARGVQVTGTGHVVCYNRIRGFADAIDTFPSARCSAIDFHNNEISEMTDDGIEMDYSFRNTRCFYNRLTNVFQGISTQPVFGGPVYIFRNVMYNVVGSPFKMHNSPSGALMIHNTSVKKGMPNVCYGGAGLSNLVHRNNLFIGTEANYAFESTASIKNSDFDYDGYGGGPWKMFLKWNNVRYSTLDEVKQKSPIYKNAIVVDAAELFASQLKPPEDPKTKFDCTAIDLRLKEGSDAIDAGVAMPGINDGFIGKAPDLGAYEFGTRLPHYGPRK